MLFEEENNNIEDENIDNEENIEEETLDETLEETQEVLEEDLPDGEDEDERVAELEKRYLSLYAEYENFRKRSIKEKEALYQDAVAEVSSSWLTLLDNIERAITANKDVTADNFENVVQGVEMLGKQATDIIAKIGIEEITCERGTEFDPELHEAVMHVEDDSLGEQQIANVFQKGFIYKGKVIRHAVVQVAN